MLLERLQMHFTRWCG